MRNSVSGAAAVLLVVLAACSNGSGADQPGIRGLNVTGEVGTEPTVRIAAPLEVERTRQDVTVEGSGPPLLVDQPFVVQLTLYDARTGKRVASTYDDKRAVLAKSSDGTLFPALTKALLGQHQGSRVVVALAAEDAFGSGGVPPDGVRTTDPLVVVADLVAVPPAEVLERAEGDALDPRAGTPEVEELAGDPVGVGTTGAEEPDDLLIVPLIQGDGDVVRDHSLVTVDYLGQAWGAGAAFVDTFFKEPAVVPVGAAGSMAAWDSALVGLRAGSRVLIVDPDAQARVPGLVVVPRRGTIAWVVDVLGVS